MKFGKRLKLQIEETLPEWRDKFLSYKGLKRLLRLAKATPTGGPAEVRFVPLLIAEVEKLNNFFVEQEEDFIIRQKELKERIQTAVESVGPERDRPSDEEYKAEMWTIRRDIVNLHGEMVLLESYSNVNYTGLAKILKKYDKRTGRLLRLPFIEKVLKQPFFTTDLISKLVKELESTIDAVFPTPSTSKDLGDASAKISPAMGSEEGLAAAAEQGILRSTVAALVTMREIRRSSSTYSHFSLPPLALPDADVLQSFQLPSPIPTQ